MSVGQVFQEGGFSMFWVLLLGLPGIAMAVVHAAMARKWSLIVTTILFALVVGSAVFGTMNGRHKCENGIVGLDLEPDLKAQMMAQGYKEAMRPVQFAGIVIVPGVALLAVGEVRRRKRPLPAR
jgi:hypothetical protein